MLFTMPKQQRQSAKDKTVNYDSHNKKLSYLQRKRASNMALLYGAKGISIWNRLCIDHECDSTVVPSVKSMQNRKFGTCKAVELSTAFDLSLTHSFGVYP